MPCPRPPPRPPTPGAGVPPRDGVIVTDQRRGRGRADPPRGLHPLSPWRPTTPPTGAPAPSTRPARQGPRRAGQGSGEPTSTLVRQEINSRRPKSPRGRFAGRRCRRAGRRRIVALPRPRCADRVPDHRPRRPPALWAAADRTVLWLAIAPCSASPARTPSESHPRTQTVETVKRTSSQQPRPIRPRDKRPRGDGETMDALGYKTDVKARTKDSIQDKKESVIGAASSAKERLVGAARPSRQDAGPEQVSVRPRATSVAQQTRSARRRRGHRRLPRRRADPDTRQGREGRPHLRRRDRPREGDRPEALERGEQVAQETAQAPGRPAKESGRQHAGRAKGSAQNHAQDDPASARS